MKRRLCFLFIFALFPVTVQAAPKFTGDELCQKAFHALKMQEPCEAWNLFRLAIKEGINDEKCSRKAQKTFKSNASACETYQPRSIASKSRSPKPDSTASNWDSDELCALAVKAKLNKDLCKAYEYLVLARQTGITTPSCRKQAEYFIPEHKESCHEDHSKITIQPPPAPTSNREQVLELCDQALIAKMNKKYCQALDLYHQADDLGISDPQCKSSATHAFITFTESCIQEKAAREKNKAGKSRHSSSNSHETPHNSGNSASEASDELCLQATKAMLTKDFCTAYKRYLKARKIGIQVEACKNKAQEVIEKYASTCDGK